MTTGDSVRALERIKSHAQDAALEVVHSVSAGHRHTLIDVSIQFIGANGLPKMDIIGTADPYLVATIDDKIRFISSVQPNTLTPVWNEMWNVKNVPNDGKLKVKVYDKDRGLPTDGHIGICGIDLLEGTKEAKIEGSFKRNNGTLWIKISTRSASSPTLLPYTFDGPISYSRHFSPTVGLFTQLDDNGKRLYSTWKMSIKGVPSFLRGPPQHWNIAYPAAQHIFGSGPTSLAVRSSIHAGHNLLYARSTRNGFGTIESAADAFALLTGGRTSPHRIKPAVYTYIISSVDDTFRFSETGAAFFVDFASKHALHANCAETVRYSGEFHPRPAGGWAAFDERSQSDADVRWELVIDNNSGTYAPDKTLLPQVRELMEHNFPFFGVVALDREDPELVQSREACREYALRSRGEWKKELQPNVHAEGEETLSHRVRVSERRPANDVADTLEMASGGTEVA
ncbi:C2-domain-containing protein [Ramaria rubella]|nr:C2-domain-containing protein [Ramaria rubella]